MAAKHYYFCREGDDQAMALMRAINNAKTAYYRCTAGFEGSVAIEDFVNQVEDDHKIVGIEIDGNQIGFIIEKKE